jgi:hypothetical protein
LEVILHGSNIKFLVAQPVFQPVFLPVFLRDLLGDLAGCGFVQPLERLVEGVDEGARSVAATAG